MQSGYRPNGFPIMRIMSRLPQIITFCKDNQLSVVELGKAWDKRKAISGVTDFRSLTIEEIVFRDTPSIPANFVFEIDKGFKYRFLSIWSS